MLKIDFKQFENVVVAKVESLPELKGEEKLWFDDGIAVRIGEAVVSRISYGITYTPLEINHFMNAGGIYLCKNSKSKYICFDLRTKDQATKYIKAMNKLIKDFNKINRER
jgi:hypothetical protein